MYILSNSAIKFLFCYSISDS